MLICVKHIFWKCRLVYNFFLPHWMPGERKISLKQLLLILDAGTPARYSKKCVCLMPLASLSPRDLLEVQILKLRPRPMESGIPKVGPSKACFNKPSR